MPKRIETQIKESVLKLEKMMTEASNQRKCHRIEMLYLIKNGEEQYKRNLAARLGYSRTTINYWLQKYEEGGLKELLKISKSSGAPTKFSPKVKADLLKKITSKKPFKTYVEIQQYLRDTYGLDLAYSTVHDFIRYQLGYRI